MPFRTALCALAVLALCRPAAAQQPSAIVEEVALQPAVVEAFDYLWPGHKLSLGPGDELVLGYLASCVRETIVGGEVEIGPRESTVTGGLVTREIVECDGGSVELSAAQAEQSGVVVFRGDDDGVQLVYSITPLFMFDSPVSEITIVRMDGDRKRLTLPVAGRVLDLEQEGKALRAGASYQLQAGDAERVIKIVRYARRGGAAVARLVRF